MYERGFDLRRMGFDDFIYVYRDDVLAQALSYAKALRTGQWSSARAPRPNADLTPPPDSTIIATLGGILLEREIYEATFSSQVVCRYRYEDFTGPNGVAVFEEVLRRLELPGEVTLSSMRKQSTPEDAARLAALRRIFDAPDASASASA